MYILVDVRLIAWSVEIVIGVDICMEHDHCHRLKELCNKVRYQQLGVCPCVQDTMTRKVHYKYFVSAILCLGLVALFINLSTHPGFPIISDELLSSNAI